MLPKARPHIDKWNTAELEIQNMWQIFVISCSRANDRVPSRCDRDLNDASLQLQIFNKKPSSIPQWPGKLTIKVTKMGKLIVNPTMTTSYGWIRTVMVLLGSTVFAAPNSASVSMGISMGTIGIAVPFLSKN